MNDYSTYEKRLAEIRMKGMELRAEEAELRFNPYHDPSNGRFTTAGGSDGGFLYSKGGKSAYVFERDIDGEYEQWKKKKSASQSATYESEDEVLYVERVLGKSYLTGDTVLEATSDKAGNVFLDYADYKETYKQNSKTTYGLYELKCGMTNANNIHGSRTYLGKSKVKAGNAIGGTRSVGINWDKVASVSGNTYMVKDFIKEKGFKWDNGTKRWVKK